MKDSVNKMHVFFASQKFWEGWFTSFDDINENDDKLPSNLVIPIILSKVKRMVTEISAGMKESERLNP